MTGRIHLQYAGRKKKCWLSPRSDPSATSWIRSILSCRKPGPWFSIHCDSDFSGVWRQSRLHTSPALVHNRHNSSARGPCVAGISSCETLQTGVWTDSQTIHWLAGGGAGETQATRSIFLDLIGSYCVEDHYVNGPSLVFMLPSFIFMVKTYGFFFVISDHSEIIKIICLQYF